MLATTMSRRDLGIKKIGSLLLKGWVMMDAVCSTPGCDLTLMRTKDSSRIICVLCDDEGSLPVPTVPAAQTLSQPKDVSEHASADQNYLDSQDRQDDRDDGSELRPSAVDLAEAEERRRQSSAATSAMGELLLKGWAMLGEVCPNPKCYGIPLMRNKEKQKYCVGCKRFLVQEAAPPSATTAADSTAPQKLPSNVDSLADQKQGADKHKLYHMQQKVDDPELDEIDSDDEFFDGPPKRRRCIEQQPAASVADNHAHSGQPSQSTVNATSAVATRTTSVSSGIEATASVLAGKLQELTDLIRVYPITATSDLGGLNALMETVTSCVNALEVCKGACKP
ncbi:uncharacterized protein BJ171DRAFT_487495 [Polychytrium aggregatum]|uniref:uncharacterized protein n=1 Tax=Polychytrium aggregatum TaxID=110093 RepID=UPI0022FDFEA1|nr:uncharacterized protein BJ171DRAFT_487495 [Polychytrium aggregatum]KAI9208849.1 hypothetical protein BJ171DRAFT_487495 [Polychytrium aggregatum]